MKFPDLDDCLAVFEAINPFLCIGAGVIYHHFSHQVGSVEGEQLARDVAMAGLGMLGHTGVRYARTQRDLAQMRPSRYGDGQRDLRAGEVVMDAGSRLRR